jgi:hypothetical protein
MTLPAGRTIFVEATPTAIGALMFPFGVNPPREAVIVPEMLIEPSALTVMVRCGFVRSWTTIAPGIL